MDMLCRSVRIVVMGICYYSYSSCMVHVTLGIFPAHLSALLKM